MHKYIETSSMLKFKTKTTLFFLNTFELSWFCRSGNRGKSHPCATAVLAPPVEWTEV